MPSLISEPSKFLASKKFLLAGLGLVGIGAASGTHHFKTSGDKDERLEKAASIGASSALWAGAAAGVGLAGYRSGAFSAAGKLGTYMAKKASPKVSSFAANLTKAKMTHGAKIAAGVGVAGVLVAAEGYVVANRPKGESQDDTSYPDGAGGFQVESGLKSRMNAMNAGGDLVFGLHNRR